MNKDGALQMEKVIAGEYIYIYIIFFGGGGLFFFLPPHLSKNAGR